VSKNGLCLTAIVAAIPGAWLAVLMIMAFVNYAGGPSVTVKALAGILLLVGGALAVMPIGIFVLAGPRAEKASRKKEAKDEEAGAAEASKAAEGDEFVTGDEATFEVDEASAGSVESFEAIDQPDVEAGSDDFDLGADFEVDEDAAPKPKKKK
jgi:hypothetical protein